MYTCFLASGEIITIPAEKESVSPDEVQAEQEVSVPNFSEDIYVQLQVTNSLLFRLYIMLFFLLVFTIFNFFRRLIKHNVTDLF